MKQILKWMVIIVLMTASVFGVIYLPEYISRSYDDSYVNTYHLYAQETSAAVNTSLSMKEKLQMLCSYDKDGNIINIMMKESRANLIRYDENLLTGLEQEIKKLENRNLIPKVSGQIDFEKHYDYAGLQAVTLNTSPGKILYLWTICFSSDEEGEYYFWVDADSYQIYAVRILNNRAIDDYMDSLVEEWGKSANELAFAWNNQYVDYLLSGEKQYEQGNTADGKEDAMEFELFDEEIFGYGPEKYDGGRGYEFYANIRDVGNIECYMYYNEDLYDAVIYSYDVIHLSHFYFCFENFILMNDNVSQAMESN